MNKLEKLTQDESGRLHRKNGDILNSKYLSLEGKIKTLVVANPGIDVSNEITKMAEAKSLFIPKGANAYVVSEFNPDTQHLRKSDLEGHEKLYSVFAVHFYFNFYGNQ